MAAPLRHAMMQRDGHGSFDLFFVHEWLMFARA
jgi:hypothetical protein